MKAAAWRWGQRLVGLGFMTLLSACELAVSADLGDVACPANLDGAVGSPFCPDQQVCMQGKCVPCAGASCQGSGAGGQGGGDAGKGGAGTSDEGGSAGAPAGAAGQSGEGGAGAAGTAGVGGAGASGAGTGGAGASGAGAGGVGGVAGASGAGMAGAGGPGPGGAGGTAGVGGAGMAGVGGVAGAGGAGMAGAGGAPFMTSGNLGSECQKDADCAAVPGASCRSREILGLETKGSICTRGCCTSSSCTPSDDDDTVCWATPSGTTMCVRGEEVGRPNVGKLSVSSKCSNGGDSSTWCRSGFCDSTGVCSDSCCGDNNCSAAGFVCQLRPVPDAPVQASYSAFQCGAASGTSPYLNEDACSGGETGLLCSSQSCDAQVLEDYSILGDTYEPACSRPCCSSPDCGQSHQVSVNVIGQDVPQDVYMGCTYVPSASAPGSTVRACAISTIEAYAPIESLKTLGGDCMTSDQCRSGFCHDGYCSDACCYDSNCSKAGFACLPLKNGSTYELRCLKQ